MKKVMFVFFIKSLGFRISAVLGSLAVVLSIVLIFSLSEKYKQDKYMQVASKAGDADERIAFISSFGWEIEEDPIDVREVYIPDEFDDTYNAYNEIQLSQDYDLSDYKGFQVTKWVYRIVNYPGYADKDCIQITLLVYNGYVIGGDVCSVELDGFMHGFKK